MFSCSNGHDLCARALIEAGADVNKGITEGEHAGWNPLMIACRDGHDLCARALIEAGARKDVRSKLGSTALSLARQNGHAAVCALLG